jgi:FMN reductase (NADPH)
MMTNPTLDLIRSHASVREYKTDPLPASLVETIISTAQCASSSSNLQSYSVIAVTGPSQREKLASLCSNQEHIRTAPLFLTWCADLARLQQVCQMQGYTQNTAYLENFLIAASDAVIAAQTAAMTAESIGLGICYIGSIRNHPREVIDLLGLPPLVFPITGMTVGWPSKETKLRPRLPLQAILHWETYDPSPYASALQEYDQTMLQTGSYKDRQFTLPDRVTRPENYGWLEHTARRVSQVFRTELKSEIEKQGFGLK